MILFNALKHHLHFIQSFIAAGRINPTAAYRELLKIGASQMDVYIGQLSVKNIENEVLSYLKQADLCGLTPYSEWINIANGYRQITLSDHSDWILRIGDSQQAYIHIHPARYAQHTVRVKANSLKTAIMLSLHGVHHFENLSIQKLNGFRSQLQLSPIRAMKDTAAIAAIFTLIQSSIQPMDDI